MTGPRYAHRLRSDALAAGVDLRPVTTATRLREAGLVEVASPQGQHQISARRVILATGSRETTRAARLIGGTRPTGVLNTGALQAMIYLQGRIPFRRPLIVGSELVSFSAVLTCRKAGILPVAMIEELPRTVAPWPCTLYPWMHGIPLFRQTRLQHIGGTARVECVRLLHADGTERELSCDGVLFTGKFVPESALIRSSHLRTDLASGGPLVDQNGRMSDPAYYAAGNVLRPIETAGWSWREGRSVAAAVAEDLAGRRGPAGRRISIAIREPIKLAVPQVVALPVNGSGLSHLQLRVERPVTGELRVSSGEKPIWRRRIRTGPERRLLVPIKSFIGRVESNTILVDVKEDRPAG